MVRVGVIGCGAIFPTHAEALKKIEGGALAAVYDIHPDRAQIASERFGVPSCPSLAELFDQVDAVDVCVPSGLHAKLGIQAATAGKHVIVEKPIDVNLASATALVDACRKADVKLACISQHRFARQIRRVRKAVQGGELGQLVTADASIKWYRTQAYYDSGDWRGTWELDGGGCLMNQGVHYVDMLQWVMGGIKSVQGLCRTLSHKIAVEDVANTLVEFKNGAVGVIQGSTSCYPGFSERLSVSGTFGSVVLEGDRICVWKVDEERAQLGKYGDGVMHQPTPNLRTYTGNEFVEDDPTAEWGEQHRLQIQDFVQAITDDREPAITGEAALEPLKVILAIYQSSREAGRRIEIS